MINRAKQHIQFFCHELPTRRVGSSNNREATSYFAEKVSTLGFDVQTPTFDCIDWQQHGAQLIIDGTEHPVQISPYSLGFCGTYQLVAAGTLTQLTALDLKNKILLLYGELAKEQLMPKNFIFYNPDEHKQIINILEEKRPRAIVAATSRNPEIAGAVYPFPLFEDGDFDIPSVYMTAEQGAEVINYIGKEALLEIKADRMPATGCNVIAQKGRVDKHRVVLFAHIDAKDGTPGALDNATGTVVLLLLAELLNDYSAELGVEIVALNGEDYYSAPGEMQYLALNENRFTEILLGINLDGVGYKQGMSAYSLYDCPDKIAGRIQEAFHPYPELIEGEPWYQGDHGLFLMNQRPALAITSQNFVTILTEIAHTPLDQPKLVDLHKLVDIAHALRDLIQALNIRDIN